MAKQQNSGNITIANIISIVGVVLLTIFTFMGNSYKSGGELGWDILTSACITGFTTFLLWFMIKAKGAENNLPKWKKAEFATLAIYIVFALSTSLLGGIMHFFVVNDNKNNIKDYASEDLAKIEKMFDEYKKFESEAVSNTGIGLINATTAGNICDTSLNEFMSNAQISRNTNSARNYERIVHDRLLGGEFNGLYDQFTEKKMEILSVVDSWSIMSIPSKANLIEKMAQSVSSELSRLSTTNKLPLIRNTGNKYSIDSYQSKEYHVDGGVESFRFRKAIKEASGFSFAALIIVLLIHTLILFNYIVAYRTSTIGIENLEEDGGRIL